MKRKRKIKIATLVFLIELGCAHSISEVCSEDLAYWKFNVNEKLSLLENRRIASTAISLNEFSFEKWSEEQLKKVEKMMGGYFRAGSKRRQLKIDLSNIANLWVEFHGYAQLQKKSRMIEMLRRIYASEEKLEGTYCTKSH